MTKANIAPAKARLSALVNKALAGEDVVLCKHGVPVVRLVPVQTVGQDDPCRRIPELAVQKTQKAMEQLPADAWGELGR